MYQIDVPYSTTPFQPNTLKKEINFGKKRKVLKEYNYKPENPQKFYNRDQQEALLKHKVGSCDPNRRCNEPERMRLLQDLLQSIEIRLEFLQYASTNLVKN